MTTATVAPFVWNGKYEAEQVRPYMDGYRAVRAELDAAGQYPYNASFKGRIPGVEGEREDTAIYLLQNLYDLDRLQERVADYLATGGEYITEIAAASLRCESIVCYGFYMGGTGWTEHKDARLVARTNDGGKPYMILPKGKRTHGYRVEGTLMAKVATR